ncbi:MAG: Trk family potassium uptake protein, partial [Firmicutes bacterium]|nr:Trk family potassium uptake protein [Bacillota bacterium]
MTRSRMRLSSLQIIILGFAAVILLGSLLLMLPVATRDGDGAVFSDALFTATSAVCVTGLIVQDTATYWSAFGHTVILALIQIGG